MDNAQLSHLFLESDSIWTGNLYHQLPHTSSTFFCINPLKDLNSGRTDANVAAYRNFLFEFDGVDLSIQLNAIEQLKSVGFKMATVVFSGGKSYHIIVSMADTLTYDYKSSWNALALEIFELTNLSADPSCKNSSRLSRLAGAIRPDTGIKQELMMLGTYASNEFVGSLINKHNVQSKSTSKSVAVEMRSNMNMEDFEYAISKNLGIKSKISNAHYWIKSENNYPELLKLTLWIIDAIGAPESVVLEYLHNTMDKKMRIAGYDINKLDVAVKNAYTYKF